MSGCSIPLLFCFERRGQLYAGGAGFGIVDPDIISDMDGELIISRPLLPPLVWSLAGVSPKKGSMSTIARNSWHES